MTTEVPVDTMPSIACYQNMYHIFMRTEVVHNSPHFASWYVPV